MQRDHPEVLNPRRKLGVVALLLSDFQGADRVLLELARG